MTGTPTRRVVGRRLIRLRTTGSTMDDVAALAATGEPEGAVVVAEEQTAGRGRAGRSWQAPFGTGLLCSILLRPRVPPARISVLPLVLGVAVAEAVERETRLRCRLKWPNDVWIDGRKVCGVLTSARAGRHGLEHVIAGIGLNVDVPSTALPADATSLLAMTGVTHDRERLLETLLERVDAAYRVFTNAGGRPDLDGWRARAALVGEEATVDIAGERRLGVVRGIADDGALLLERTDGSVERIVAGELVRGPVRTTAMR